MDARLGGWKPSRKLAGIVRRNADHLRQHKPDHRHYIWIGSILAAARAKADAKNWTGFVGLAEPHLAVAADWVGGVLWPSAPQPNSPAQSVGARSLR